MTLQKTKYFLLSLLIALSGSLFSQQYNIKSFSTKNGLINSSVNQIFLDSRGYLWFATEGGLSRFDGKTFRNFTTKEGLLGNNVTSICEDKDGEIWIASFGEGVSMFDGHDFIKYDKANGIRNTDIFSIFCDSKNHIWLATSGGITVYDRKRFRNYTTDDGLPGNEFFCVTEDSKGKMWFGSKHKGLVSFDGKSFHGFMKKDGLSDDNIFCLRNDRKGNLWIGTTKGGVCILKDGIFSEVRIPGLEKALVYAIRQDQRNNMWFATERGLFKLDPSGKFSDFTDKNGLNSNDLYALCEDYEGNIWTGSNLGACLLKDEDLITYSEKEGLTNVKVNVILQDQFGNLLIGTDGSGISILGKDGKINPVKIKELENTKVISLCQDSQHRIWVGLNSDDKNPLLILKQENGILALDRTYHEFNKVKFSTVSKILEDKKGNIWAATFGSGVFVISKNDIVQFKEDKVKSLNIFSMIQDSKENIWFGTFEKGLVKYDGTTFTNYAKANGLSDNWIWSICEGKDGNIYCGTHERGISRFDGKNFKNLSTTQNLASDLVYAVAINKEHGLWVGTDKGINKISLDKDFNITSLKYYGEDEGLHGTEISQNGFMYDNKGDLWICTTSGLTKYDAKYDYVNSTVPSIVLNNIRLYYSDVDWSKYAPKIDPVSKFPVGLALSHKDNHLTFDYQALTTDKVKYTFKLDGLDADWSPLTSNTQAVYTNIPPGKNYVFRVKAVNTDGFWSKDVPLFAFSITPPFWKTWWFLSLCVLVTISVVIVFIRVRTAKLETEKKILEEKVEERTTELKGANDQLSIAFKDIKDSINYAKRIQQAILPLEAEIRKDLPEHFIFFKPRDVVSGDFYWFNKKNDKIYIAACDCTGHGVPGAFMSIIGNSLLNEIAHETSVSEPALILNALRDKIILALKQRSSDQETKDGMDMVLCCIDRKNKKLSFAGANNPLYIIRQGRLMEYKGNKQPIGVYADQMKPFTNQEVELQQGDLIYLFSDGYPDQFGGPKGKKFLYTRFKELLVSISGRSMDKQYTDLERSFWEWKKDQEQVDDVLVIGIRV
jgi:ligand-binding sensor domain-containing protein/serine phosphatase RsbU (regulator of sigma subunit)